MQLRTRRFPAVVALALGGLVGCGSEEDRIKLVPVSGTVTENGKPLGGATITFLPDPGNAFSTPGVDTTGPEGNYKLMFKNRSGVSPGKYKVTITPDLTQVDGVKMPEEFKDDPYMGRMALGLENPSAKPKKKAGLKNEFDAEVDADGGPLDFDVKGSLK